MLTTYLLRLDNEPSDALACFIERVNTIESPIPFTRIRQRSMGQNMERITWHAT